MLHALIDSCIYRADPKRNKPAFRAVTRLGAGGKLKVQVPAMVLGEFVSQQQQQVQGHLAKVAGAADNVLHSTTEKTLRDYAANVAMTAKNMQDQANDLLAAEFRVWMKETNAIEHLVKPEHSERVTAAYFAGTPPFRAPKHRDVFPDWFIWQTALDLVAEHGKLLVVSNDGRQRQTAADHKDMTAFATLDEFINAAECQTALNELLTSEIVAKNVQRIKALVPSTGTDYLLRSLASEVVHELAGKTVRHPAIPDDNNEATILSVGEPENVEFTFDELEHYGDADIGIPFTATVDCNLHYAIFKSDYYCLDEDNMERIGISDLNRHYYDAEENCTINIKGYITILIDPDELQEGNLSGEELQMLIKTADTSTEITEREVYAAGY